MLRRLSDLEAGRASDSLHGGGVDVENMAWKLTSGRTRYLYATGAEEAGFGEWEDLSIFTRHGP